MSLPLCFYQILVVFSTHPSYTPGGFADRQAGPGDQMSHPHQASHLLSHRAQQGIFFRVSFY